MLGIEVIRAAARGVALGEAVERAGHQERVLAK
jgi:hypothetical protein